MPGSKRTTTPKRQPKRHQLSTPSQHFVLSKVTKVSKDGKLEHHKTEEIAFSHQSLSPLKRRQPVSAEEEAAGAEKKQRVNPPTTEEEPKVCC